jgi:hypothetical protein
MKVLSALPGFVTTPAACESQRRFKMLANRLARFRKRSRAWCAQIPRMQKIIPLREV